MAIIILYSAWDSGWAMLFALGLIYGSRLLHKSGNFSLMYERRLQAAESSPRSKIDSPLILYLRSFADDTMTANPPETEPSAWNTEMDPRGIASFKTEEEQLAAVMAEFGRFRAVGNPDDALPESGVVREYIGQDWQRRVHDLLMEAQLVLVRLGSTKGVLWELDEVVQHVMPERLLLLVPYDAGEYAAFRNQHERAFPHGLPDHGATATRKVGTIHGIISFDSDWMPQFLCLEEDMYAPDKPLQGAMKVALVSVFDRLGFSYSPPILLVYGIAKWFRLVLVVVWGSAVTLLAFCCFLIFLVTYNETRKDNELLICVISLLVASALFLWTHHRARNLIKNLRKHLYIRKRAMDSQKRANGSHAQRIKVDPGLVIPRPPGRQGMVWVRFFRIHLKQLLHLNESPHRIALAFAVGVFIAFSPPYGLHTLIVFFCVLAFRLNAIAMLSGSFLNNPWTLIPILGATLWTGSQFPGMPEMPPFQWEAIDPTSFYQHIMPYFVPFVAGGIVLSVLGALISYPIAYGLISQYRSWIRH